MMKIIHSWIVYIFLIFFTAISAQRDTSIDLAIYAGASLAGDDFEQFATTGYVAGVRGNILFNSNFGVATDFNIQSHNFENSFDFSRLIADPLSTTSNGTWKNTTFSVGPVYRFGSKVKIQAFVLGGLSLVESPEASVLWSTPFDLDDSVLNFEKQEESGFGLTTGLDIVFPLFKELSLSITPQYVYSRASIRYTIKDPDTAVFTSDAGEDVFEPGILAQSDPEVRELSLSHFNVKAGLSYTFGSKKKSTDDARDDTGTSCLPTVLQFPNNNTEYVLDSDMRPTFQWENPQATVFTFQLLEGGKIVFEQRTSKEVLEHSRALEKVYNRDRNGNYTWQLLTEYEDCEVKLSRKRTISFGNRSGAFHDVTYLDCNSPAYLPDGSLNLKGEITFFNNISTTDNLVIDTSSIQVNGGTITFSNTYICPNIPLTPTLIIPPGGSSQLCFDVVLPSGTFFLDTTVDGTINGLSQISNDRDEVPSCTCDICDTDWYFVSTNKVMRATNNFGQPFNFRINDEIQVLGATRNIRHVSAEIVSVKHVANDEQCYKCTKHDDQMGMFPLRTPGIVPRIQTPLAQQFTNGREGLSPADDNNDGFVGQVMWVASDLTTGIDFSSAPMRFDFPINLPEPSSLDCCEHTYEVCMRYTFTDLNCVSCDYYVCYIADGNIPATGGPGTGTSTGNSTPLENPTTIGNLKKN